MRNFGWPKIPHFDNGYVRTEDQIESSSWSPSWKKIQAAKHARVNKAHGSEEKLMALLKTPEWRGATYEHTERQSGVALRPVIVIKHPSGASCVIWKDLVNG